VIYWPGHRLAKNNRVFKSRLVFEAANRIHLTSKDKIGFRDGNPLNCEPVNLYLKNKGVRTIICEMCGKPGVISFGNLTKSRRHACSEKCRSGLYSAMRRGESHWKAKVTDDEVVAIRDERAKGSSTATIAKKWNLAKWHIRRLVRGESFKHLPVMRS
jgi:hypothetical protein